MTDAEIRENAAGDFVMPDGSVVDRKNFAPYTDVPRPQVGTPVAAPIPDAAADEPTLATIREVYVADGTRLTWEARGRDFDRAIAAVRDAALTEAAEAVDNVTLGSSGFADAVRESARAAILALQVRHLREGTPNE